ncbi:hypothetical protein PoB_007164600 [Plakobranchus ocellatus]|uniref:Uncharacterized protein n=1 Tax=Plakobranchus ocellatus TaxID=259542 RepID=A0AAV4DLS8_9GAST|nr:hypothetical protein PoB_007164600 [Plakobranchus ocellatus]
MIRGSDQQDNHACCSPLDLPHGVHDGFSLTLGLMLKFRKSSEYEHQETRKNQRGMWRGEEGSTLLIHTNLRFR